MKVNNIAPVVFGILMTILIIFATSCTNTQDIVHSHTIKYPCPTFKNK